MNILNRKKISVNLIILIGAVSILFYSFSTGVTGKTLKNGNGCECHGAASDDVLVTITGPDTLTPGESAAYTLTIMGGELVRGGTNIASSNGDLAPVGSDLQLISGELTHVSPKAPVSNAVSFEFTYTAPNAAGEQTLYANGNSVNFNGNNSGDKWNFAPNKIVTVAQVTGVEDDLNELSYKLNQNYPNPFNPSTRISFTLQKGGDTKLFVYNVAGEKVQELFSGFLESGKHTIDFNASGLSSGIYYYKLITGEFISTRKMMLIK